MVWSGAGTLAVALVGYLPAVTIARLSKSLGYYSTLNRVSLVHTSALQVIKQQYIVLLTLQKIDRCNDLCYN
jgi:hypothetical protein